MTGYLSKKMLGAARLPDTPSARAYLEKVLEDDDTQVYKKPWVGLTDEEMQAVVDAQPLVSNINVYFKAIEQALKEKNT